MNQLTKNQTTQLEQAKTKGLKPDRTWDASTVDTSVENFNAHLLWLEQRYGGPAKRSGASPCHARLYRGRKCPAGCSSRCFDSRGDIHRCLSEDADHAALWLVSGKIVALTSETYDLETRLPREREWADKHGLDVHVFPDRSFWNPGGCALIVFTAKQDGWLPIIG